MIEINNGSSLDCTPQVTVGVRKKKNIDRLV